jgi:hypothetical protein
MTMGTFCNATDENGISGAMVDVRIPCDLLGGHVGRRPE